MTANDRLVASIYSAATDPQLWPRVLEDARAALGLSAVNLLFIDPTERRPPFILESGHEPAAVELWRSRADEDPNLLAGLAHPGELVWSERVMEAGAYARDPFVNEVMRPGGLWHVLGHVSDAPDAVFGAGMHRPRTRPFTDADARRIEPVLRHLHRAMQVHYRVSAAAEDRRMLADLLDRLRAGALLLDRGGAVVLANRAAVAIAAANDGFTLTGGVAAATPAATRALRLAMVRVASGAGSASISLRRPSGRDPYRVLVVPLAAESSDARAGVRRAAALTLVTDPDPPFRIEAESLRGLFDFTAAEGRVAAELLAGKRTTEIATALGITRNTVRVHVRHLLEKSGVSSRTELVAKLASHLPEALVVGAEPGDLGPSGV